MNSQSLLIPALDLLGKSVAVLALAGAANLLLRRLSASVRHAVWLSALIILLLLPLTTAMTPRWSLRSSAPAAADVAAAPVIVEQVKTIAPRTAEAGDAQPWRLPQWPAIALAGWAVGACCLLGYALLGKIQLVRLRRQSTAIVEARVSSCCRRISAEMRLRRRTELRSSGATRVPMTWGIFGHVLLLPKGVEEWSDARLEAALRHELGHIARGDYFTRQLAHFARALYWPNPLAWLAVAALRREQEKACDDLVLRAGTPAETYATLLLEAARSLQGARFFVREAVAMARPSTLEGRILGIVDTARDRRSAGLLVKLATAVFGIVALAASGLAQVRADGAAAAPAPNSAANVPASAVAEKASRIIIPRLAFREATVREGIDFLRQKSATLSPDKKGINFVLSVAPDQTPPKVTLSLENISVFDAARYVAQLAGLELVADEQALVLREPGGSTPSTSALEAKNPQPEGGALAKARTIVVPKLEWREASVREGVEFLKTRAHQLDPEKAGLNIIVGPGVSADTRITLSLENVPVSEVLRYMAGMAKLKLTADPNAIIVEPADSAGR